MLRWIRDAIHRLIFGRSLRSALEATSTVRVHGVKFVIRKLSPLDYLDGSQIMLQYYDEYKRIKEGASMSDVAVKRMKAHYADVFVNAVVSPKIVRKQEEDKGDEQIFVDFLFTDMQLANDLYLEIMSFANGKKKTLKLGN